MASLKPGDYLQCSDESAETLGKITATWLGNYGITILKGSPEFGKGY